MTWFDGACASCRPPHTPPQHLHPHPLDLDHVRCPCPCITALLYSPLMMVCRAEGINWDWDPSHQSCMDIHGCFAVGVATGKRGAKEGLSRWGLRPHTPACRMPSCKFPFLSSREVAGGRPGDPSEGKGNGKGLFGLGQAACCVIIDTDTYCRIFKDTCLTSDIKLLTTDEGQCGSLFLAHPVLLCHWIQLILSLGRIVSVSHVGLEFAFGCWREHSFGSASNVERCSARDTVNHTYLKQPESDQIAAWVSRGAGLFTDEILQTVRDPTSLSAQR